MFFPIFRHWQRQFGDGNVAPSRRDVLQAALAAAGGLLSAETLAAQKPRPNRSRVLIVGAGFAGLACADELASAGYPVTVVEARDRVGGRVHTFRDLAAGKTIEGGGELVGPNQPTWMAYAKRFKLSFVELPWNPADVVWLDDALLKPDVARALWNEMRLALERLNDLALPIDAFRPWLSPRAREIDGRSLDDWIGSLDASERCKQLIAIQMTGINGLIPAWQSLLCILAIIKGGGVQKFWDETDTMHCVGGTQQLAEKLAESFVERRGSQSLRLRTAIQELRVRDEKISARFSDGSRQEFDDVVLTAPPTTWHKIAFDPPLPPQLVVPMAASTKFLAVVNRPVWREQQREPNAMSSGTVQLTWETTAGQGEAGQHALVAFAGGREADEVRGWPASERENRFRAELERFFPGIGRAWAGGRFVDWVSDPWARGTYSFPAPGQIMTVGPLLEASHHGHLHFAGEHTCYAFVGWMEGALNSGVRVAHRLAKRDGLVE